MSTRGHIDKPVNVVWQTREAPPTDFENRVGDALEQVFDAGIEALPALIAKLAELGCKDPQGRPWTEQSLQEWLRQRA